MYKDVTECKFKQYATMIENYTTMVEISQR
jgi:hypothetical protein